MGAEAVDFQVLDHESVPSQEDGRARVGPLPPARWMSNRIRLTPKQPPSRWGPSLIMQTTSYRASLLNGSHAPKLTAHPPGNKLRSLLSLSLPQSFLRLGNCSSLPPSPCEPPPQHFCCMSIWLLLDIAFLLPCERVCVWRGQRRLRAVGCFGFYDLPRLYDGLDTAGEQPARAKWIKDMT